MTDDAELELLRKRVAALEAELGALRDDQAMLRTVLETTPAFVLRVSLDGEITFINRLTPGYESRDPVGTSIYSYAPPDQHEVMRNAFETTRRTGEVTSFESIALSLGKPAWYWTVVGPIRQDGQLVGLTLIVTNITRVKNVELELLESRERLRTALDAGNVGVWRWDSVRDVVEWDDKLCAMFGVAPAEAPRTREQFLAMVSDDQRESLRLHIERALSTGVYLDYELRADVLGEVRWFVIKGGVVRDASGAVMGLLGGVVDDTMRRRLMEQVREAQKLDALGQLTAGVAHNFNNMLAAVVPALELAARDARPDVAPLLIEAKHTALRAAELIKQLMLFSLPEPRRPRRFESLEGVLERALSLCRSTFGREIAIDATGLELAANVLVDGLAMEQAVLNVLINARDALRGVDAPRARIDVTVEERGAKARQGAARELVVKVHDTGSGMDEKTRARVFEPFFTTKPIGQGTGLGLSTAWATARAHKGSLTCDSTPGVGTTFSFALPLDPTSAVLRAVASADVAAAGRGEVVLVIEDEGAVREAVATVLRKAGYAVITASSGEEGVRLFRERPAAVVLLDHSMPGQPPTATLAQLRELAPKLPIVSFSGLGTALPGATAHLDKPVDSATLLVAIRGALSG